MTVPAEQLDRIEHKEVMERGDVVRNKIGRLLADPYFQRTLDKEALKNYQELVDKKGHIDPNDTESLNKFYRFMADQFEEVQTAKKRITSHVEQAIRDKVITEKDRVFYKKNMKANVVSGNQIVTKEMLEQAEKDILESLENRRKERKEYDELANSPLVQAGFLLIDKNKKIPFPDETGYLKMSVPERRKWLKEIQKMLPKAKEYANSREEKEVKRLEEQYDTLLEAAQKEGVIGKKTTEKFKSWFKGQNAETKKYAISQFVKETNRYRVLWKDIRKNLKGSAISRLENLKDQMGYTELRAEFIKEQYTGKLKEVRQQKIISKHTENAFLADFEQQSPERKQVYLDQFDSQIERYKGLRNQIDKMKDRKAQQVLNQMYESGNHGFGEIQAKYNRLTGQQLPESDKGEKSDLSLKILSTITNTTVRKEILHAKKSLSQGEKKTFVERLTHYFSGRQSDQQDAVSYQDNIRTARRQHEKAYQQNVAETAEEPDQNEGLEGSRQNLQIHEVDEKAVERASQDISKKDRSISPSKTPEIRIKKSTDRAYQQNTFVDEKGRKRRVVRVGGTKEGVQAFNNEGLLNRDKDELSVMAKDGSNIVEMKMREVRVMEEVLRKSLEEDEADKKKVA
ncbi:phage tail tape measure protein [Candidatus Peregrinibacteria bacterium]|nr:phage tail tape measure protein [Candidatus Peregrinibacteria bacterium]